MTKCLECGSYEFESQKTTGGAGNGIRYSFVPEPRKSHLVNWEENFLTLQRD